MSFGDDVAGPPDLVHQALAADIARVERVRARLEELHAEVPATIEDCVEGIREVLILLRSVGVAPPPEIRSHLDDLRRQLAHHTPKD